VQEQLLARIIGEFFTHMNPNLKEQFRKIGARVKFVFVDAEERIGFTRVKQPPASLDVIEDKEGEIFQINIRRDVSNKLDLSVLEVLPKDKHLVLLARQLDADGKTISKDHFLCGHDERHLFVAGVDKVSTVAAAKASLKPAEIFSQEIGVTNEKRNRRKTKVFKRQGEWFFTPANIEPKPTLILKDEPLRRNNRSKAHIAEFAYRSGGEEVRVCSQFPNGLTQEEYKTLIADNPKAKYFNWRNMKRNAAVYAKGKIRHADHATVHLDTWHRVLMNTERFPENITVVFLD
jgi:hypothetical protein